MVEQLERVVKPTKIKVYLRPPE